MRSERAGLPHHAGSIPFYVAELLEIAAFTTSTSFMIFAACSTVALSDSSPLIMRTTRDNFQNLPSRTAGLVAAERSQQRCFDILTTEVKQILEGLTRDA
jgi:hypothetical protein